MPPSSSGQGQVALTHFTSVRIRVEVLLVSWCNGSTNGFDPFSSSSNLGETTNFKYICLSDGMAYMMVSKTIGEILVGSSPTSSTNLENYTIKDMGKTVNLSPLAR